MELELARAVLTEAISGEFLDKMPETDEAIIEYGKYYAENAQLEYNSGWGKNNETVKAIVSLTSQEPDKSPSSAQPESGDGAGSAAFFKGLPLPGANEAIYASQAPITMPFDLSALDDQELRRHHGIFQHYFGLTRYQLAEETASLVAAEHLRDDAFRKAYKAVPNKKEKTLKAVETEAMEDATWVEWNEKVILHEEVVTKLKALAEIYAKNVDVLSREATIRQNEYERNR